MVRNPLYLGNFIAFLGFALATKSWWFVLLMSLAYWLYIERIIVAEERFLVRKFGAAYIEWARNTPAFVPRFSRWRRPAHCFSVRRVLRCEHHGVLAVAASYLAMELMVDLGTEGADFALWLEEDQIWVWLFIAALIVFVGLRRLKKHTRFLIVPNQ